MNVNVNQTSLLGKDTALHFAVMISNRDVVFALLHRGANPNVTNKHGACPLHNAKEKGIASLLVTFGASTSIKDANQRKPVDCLLEQGFKKTSDLVRFLMEIEDATETNMLTSEIQENRRKKKEVALLQQKENEAREANEKASRRKDSMQSYLSWRRGS